MVIYLTLRAGKKKKINGVQRALRRSPVSGIKMGEEGFAKRYSGAINRKVSGG